MSKFKYFVSGVLCCLLLMGSFGFAEGVSETIEAILYKNISITGEKGNQAGDLITYGDDIYISLQTLENVTHIGMEYFPNINTLKFTRLKKDSQPDKEISLRANYEFNDTSGLLKIKWNDVNADHYHILIKNEDEKNFNYYLDDNGNPDRFYYFDDCCISFSNAGSDSLDTFMIEAVKDNETIALSNFFIVDRKMFSTNNNLKSYKDKNVETQKKHGEVVEKYNEPIKEIEEKSNDSIAINLNNIDAIEKTTHELLLEKHGSNRMIGSISKDSISPNADKNKTSQDIWLRTFANSFSNYSANTGGRANSYAISGAISDANAAVD